MSFWNDFDVVSKNRPVGGVTSEHDKDDDDLVFIFCSPVELPDDDEHEIVTNERLLLRA